MKELVFQETQDFSDIDLFVVQHIKDNSVKFIKYLNRSGFKSVTVIGKPYSADLNVRNKIAKYAEVIISSIEELESLDIIARVLRDNLVSGEKFLCLDLGGYFSKYFEQQNISPENCLGIIEDTANGIWFDEMHYIPKRPLASVATSNIKDSVEHYFVARAILRNLENILINNFQQTTVLKNVLVCGYGRIGHRIANLLKNSNVYICEIDSLKRLKAVIDGYKILAKDELSKIDLIIGITGNIVFSDDLLDLKDGCFLVNGSTRQKEFDFSSIQFDIKEQLVNKDFIKYKLNNNKKLYLLANGFPVNFWNTESTPEFCLDGVFSTIYLLARRFVNQSYEAGFYPSEKYFLEDERLVADLWIKKYLS